MLRHFKIGVIVGVAGMLAGCGGDDVSLVQATPTTPTTISTPGPAPSPSPIPTSTAAPTPTRQIVISDDFNAGTLNPLWSTEQIITGGYTFEDSPFGGGKALKLSLEAFRNYPDASSPTGEKARAELKMYPVNSNERDERWYYFDMMIPTNWARDTATKDIIVQFYPGGGSGPPAIAFEIEKDDFQIRNYLPTTRTIWTEKVADVKGRWMRFYLHVRWSHSSDAYGLIELHRSFDPAVTGPAAPQLATVTGRNTSDTGVQAFFKIGHYLGTGWRPNAPNESKVILFDRVTIEKP